MTKLNIFYYFASENSIHRHRDGGAVLRKIALANSIELEVHS